MPYPTTYDVTYSYTGFQQAQGDDSFPGTQLDADLAGLESSVSSLALFVRGVMRSDGALNNGIVTYDSLAASLQTAGLAPAVAWTTGVFFAKNVSVVQSSNLYRCLVAHTSGVFATDLAAGKWIFVAALQAPSFTQAGTGAVTRTMQDKVRERVSALDFGADPTGVADSQPAIQAAVNSLPLTGGDVYLPAGTCKINSAIILGNGAGVLNTPSTRYGIRLIGAGMGAKTFLSGTGATRLLWGNASPGNMVIVAGTLEGWGVQNIAFDGNSVAANGLVVFEASFGDSKNLSFSGLTATNLLLTTYAPVASAQNSMHNCFLNTHFNILPLSSAIGILLDGAPGSANTCYNTFINTSINLGPFGVGQTALYLRSCDSNLFLNTHVFNGGNANTLVLDYTVSSSWPASNSFYGFDPIASGVNNYVNVGTPGVAAAANWIYGLVTTNTAVPPNLPNLTYLAPYQLGGSQSNDSAVAGAVGELISSTVASGSAIALTTNAPANITSISLTAGDWDVQGDVYFTGNAATTGSYQAASVSQTSANLDLTPGNYNINPNYGSTPFGSTTGNTSGIGVFTPVTRKSLAATTTIYLVAQAGFGVSTQSAYGKIRARRIR